MSANKYYQTEKTIHDTPSLLAKDERAIQIAKDEAEKLQQPVDISEIHIDKARIALSFPIDETGHYIQSREMWAALNNTYWARVFQIQKQGKYADSESDPRKDPLLGSKVHPGEDIDPQTTSKAKRVGSKLADQQYREELMDDHYHHLSERREWRPGDQSTREDVADKQYLQTFDLIRILNELPYLRNGNGDKFKATLTSTSPQGQLRQRVQHFESKFLNLPSSSINPNIWRTGLATPFRRSKNIENALRLANNIMETESVLQHMHTLFIEFLSADIELDDILDNEIGVGSISPIIDGEINPKAVELLNKKAKNCTGIEGLENTAEVIIESVLTTWKAMAQDEKVKDAIHFIASQYNQQSPQKDKDPQELLNQYKRDFLSLSNNPENFDTLVTLCKVLGLDLMDAVIGYTHVNNIHFSVYRQRRNEIKEAGLTLEEGLKRIYVYDTILLKN